MAFKAPFFRPEELCRFAEAFLAEHNSCRQIPVPIEHIVDVRLGIEIVPVPGLGSFDTVAYLSRDLSEIRVDEFVYQHRPNRYRFSLAHELGHRVLHADVYRQFEFSDVVGWKHVMTNVIPEDQYGYLEWHANSFAGLVLVPATELRHIFFDYVVKGQAQEIDFDEPGTGAREVVEAQISRVFEVSAEVIHRRIEFDKLWH